MNKGKVVELVVYRVTSEAASNTALLVDTVNEHVKAFEGFISRQVHQSTDDPQVYMDYVHWEQLAHAQAAAAQIGNVPELAPFMAAIEEVISFAHYELR